MCGLPLSSCCFADAKTALIGVGLISVDERFGMPVLEKGMSYAPLFKVIIIIV